MTNLGNLTSDEEQEKIRYLSPAQERLLVEEEKKKDDARKAARRQKESSVGWGAGERSRSRDSRCMLVARLLARSPACSLALQLTPNTLMTAGKVRRSALSKEDPEQSQLGDQSRDDDGRKQGKTSTQRQG